MRQRIRVTSSGQDSSRARRGVLSVCDDDMRFFERPAADPVVEHGRDFAPEAQILRRAVPGPEDLDPRALRHRPQTPHMQSCIVGRPHRVKTVAGRRNTPAQPV